MEHSWWLFAVIVLVLTVGVWALFRSLRKWQQPPPGKDADSQSAEIFLESTSKTSGYNSF